MDGKTIILFPADHILWTKDLLKVLNPFHKKHLKCQHSRYEIWISGNFSALAHRKLTDIGWKLHTQIGEKLKKN